MRNHQSPAMNRDSGLPVVGGHRLPAFVPLMMVIALQLRLFIQRAWLPFVLTTPLGPGPRAFVLDELLVVFKLHLRMVLVPLSRQIHSWFSTFGALTPAQCCGHRLGHTMGGRQHLRMARDWQISVSTGARTRTPRSMLLELFAMGRSWPSTWGTSSNSSGRGLSGMANPFALAPRLTTSRSTPG